MSQLVDRWRSGIELLSPEERGGPEATAYLRDVAKAVHRRAQVGAEHPRAPSADRIFSAIQGLIRQNPDATDADLFDALARDRTALRACHDFEAQAQAADSEPRWKPLAQFSGSPAPEAVVWRECGTLRDRWPVVSAGEPGILSGPGGVGKSTLALALAVVSARAWDEGRSEADCLGLQVRPGPVLLVSYEDVPARLANRVERAGEIPKALDVIEPPGPLHLGNRKIPGSAAPTSTWRTLERWCEGHPLGLVVIDPVGDALLGVDASDAEAVRCFMGAVSRLPGSPGVLLVGHDTKAARTAVEGGRKPGAGAISGTSAWHDRARGVVHVRDVGGEKLVYQCLKSNHGRRYWGGVLRPHISSAMAFAGFRLDSEGVKSAEEMQAWLEKAPPRARGAKSNGDAVTGRPGVYAPEDV